MILKEVTHDDDLFKDTSIFDIRSNRFYLFNENGEEINSWELRKIDGYENLEVLETAVSRFYGYGVAFNVTHIKLKVDHLNLTWHKTDYHKKLKFGQIDRV